MIICLTEQIKRILKNEKDFKEKKKNTANSNRGR
jgi:hypothetical protein